MALLLNLLPIPGLDGYGALEPHLSYETQRALAPAKQWGFVILFVLLFIPPVNFAFFSLVEWVFSLSGVNPRLAGLGLSLTRFWSAWF
jgi:Zn-dependent protease